MPSSVKKLELEEFNEILVRNGFPVQGRMPFSISTLVDTLNQTYDPTRLVTYKDIWKIVAYTAEIFDTAASYAWLIRSVRLGTKYIIPVKLVPMIVARLKAQGKL